MFTMYSRVRHLKRFYHLYFLLGIAVNLCFLQDLYGINEAKIQGYSPSEAQKIYERPVNRKANARFNPKATVEIIRLGGNTITPTEQLEEEGRRDLVAKYLGVRQHF